jgi:UDP-GlcNAc:undecaprenyl-phosphate GlcNAc-1-phosphate transferase
MIYPLLLISFLVSLVLNYFLKQAGEGFGFYDLARGPLKIHKKPISYLGGLAIFLATVFLFFINKSFNFQIGGILFGGFLMFIIGFWDDLRWKKEGVQPLKKLFFLVLFSLLVSVILINSEIKINFLPGKILIFFLTFLYVLGLINAVNFEDGIDGLAGGLVAISLIGFIILSIIWGNNLGLVISLILLGAVLGFLVFNFPPAKIFMGDSGAYFL